MTKKIIHTLILITAGLHSFSQQGRQVIDFDNHWRFFLGDDSAAIHPGYDDTKWRLLNLPHDWSIEGSFNEKNPATTQGGALPAGIGWYRKVFVQTPGSAGKNTRIEFDGIYRNSEVWINGHWLGKRPYGYSSFSYSLTDYLKPAPEKNTIAVKVDNSRQPNSRWYSGSGIYRNTRLVITDRIAIAHWGVQVYASALNAENGGMCKTKRTGAVAKKGYVNIRINFENNAIGTEKLQVVNKISDGNGKLVYQSADPLRIDSNEKHAMSVSFDIDHPVLWSVEHPFLYTCTTQLFAAGKIIDSYATRFGIRDFYFDADKGFFLNGKYMKIKGVCLHHDLGALGAAVNIRAIERQLQILKAMGCNAIRTAHNPPSPEFLDLCDKMGFLVLEEAFDMWQKKKNKFDYAADFNEWHTADITNMVMRDRNHPSVFMWSIGNEIREQFDSSGTLLAKELVSLVKAADATRPVTAALSEWNPARNFIYQSDVLDIVGLNYHQEVYEDFHKYYPGKIFLGTENMSAFATRGHYDMPSDSPYFWPAKSPQKIVENGNADFTVSAYDQVAAYWGSTHEATWKIIKKHDFLSGLFVWSGFDFLGEPIPYPWPARSSYYGIIDLAGFPKDVYYMYQSEWTDKPVLHLFPHWNWPLHKPVDVWVYYNQADEVELFLNGKSLGVRRKMAEDLHVMWRIPFEPGLLKAVSRKRGKIVLIKEIHTAGAAANIKLIADRRTIKADGRDLSFITASIVDRNGYLVPGANQLLHFNIAGPGSLAATDNGYQADTTAFKSPNKRCWKGMALAIVQSAQKKGNITVTVSSAGLPATSLTLKTSR